MDKIEARKKKIASNLKKIRNQYITVIFSGLIEQKNIREIHKNIRKVTEIANNNNIFYTKNMENFALRVAQKSKKQVDAMLPRLDYDEIALAMWIFKKFNRENIYQKTNTISYEVAKSYEAEYKEKMIENELKHNRNLAIPRIFYLASSHSDCAIDHLDYQGKVYVDNKWKSLITDDELKNKIEKYIIKHNVKSYQWVIGKPVWFITRPNCRHYFKSIKTDEILSQSVAEITKKHHLYSDVGKKITQTIKHPINKGWYSKKNVEDIIHQYEERLDYHISLYKMKKVDIILRAIEKDRLLIKKWKEYLQKI